MNQLKWEVVIFLNSLIESTFLPMLCMLIISFRNDKKYQQYIIVFSNYWLKIPLSQWILKVLRKIILHQTDSTNSQRDLQKTIVTWHKNFQQLLKWTAHITEIENDNINKIVHFHIKQKARKKMWTWKISSLEKLPLLIIYWKFNRQ